VTGSAKNNHLSLPDHAEAGQGRAESLPVDRLPADPLPADSLPADGALDRARGLDLPVERSGAPGHEGSPRGEARPAIERATSGDRDGDERSPEPDASLAETAAPSGPWSSRWSRLAHGLGIAPSTPVAVALSGGADSVYLLHLLARAENRPKVLAIHVDHRLRGDESHDDAAFCARLCAKLGVPFARRVAEIDPEGGDVEGRAREARYKALSAEASAAGIAVVLTGHHENDAVETLLMRWMRGSDIGGLAGLRRETVLGKGHVSGDARPAGIRVLRPLLGMRREEVRSALRREQLGWREDSSNDGAQFSRNRVRNEVLPQIEESCGKEGVENFFEFARAIESFEDELADRTGHVQWQPVAHEAARRSTAMPELGGTIDRSELEALGGPLLRRALGRLIGEGTGRRPTRGLLAELGDSIEQGRTLRLDVHEGWTVQLRSDALHLTPPAERLHPAGAEEGGAIPATSTGTGTGQELSSAPIAGAGLTLGIPGAVQLEDGRSICAEVVTGESDLDPLDPTSVEIDGDGIGELRVRFARPGDRFQAAGAPGHKPVRRFLGEAGIPREERGLVPMVLADEEVVWVAGVAVSQRRTVTNGASRVIRLSLDGARGKSVR